MVFLLACSGVETEDVVGSETESGEASTGDETETTGDGDTGDGDGTSGDGDGDGDGDGTSGDGDGDGQVGELPTAMINHPGDGEMRQVNSAIPMVGVASDAEDGTLSGASLVWSADTVGMIGTGEMFDWTPTQTGPVVITLRATDSDSNETVDSVALQIIP
jgi:hypothetical protein